MHDPTYQSTYDPAAIPKRWVWRRFKFDNNQRSAVAAMARNGISRTEIAARLAISLPTLRKHCWSELNLNPKSRPLRPR